MTSQDNISTFYKWTTRIGFDKNVMKNCHIDDLQRIHYYYNAIITKSNKQHMFLLSEEMEVCTKYLLPKQKRLEISN